MESPLHGMSINKATVLQCYQLVPCCSVHAHALTSQYLFYTLPVTVLLTANYQCSYTLRSYTKKRQCFVCVCAVVMCTVIKVRSWLFGLFYIFRYCTYLTCQSAVTKEDV